MGGENDSGSFFPLCDDLIFEHTSVDGVETTEGFIKDQKLWFVDYGYQELNFLLHSFG